MLAASHRDQPLRALSQLVREFLRRSPLEVDADLAHGLEDLRVNALRARYPPNGTGFRRVRQRLNKAAAICERPAL